MTLAIVDQPASQALIRYEMARRELLYFTEYTFPNYIADPAHELIASELDRVVDGTTDRLILVAPPQHGKSELASVRLPAYWLARRPDDPIMLSSYAASLAQSKSGQARDLCRSIEYRQLFGSIRVRDDADAKEEWHLSGRRGYMKAVGVGGPITGHGGLLGIIDDPFENWAEAQSETIRNTVWDWYRSTFRPRIWEGGAIVIIMTRWHEDDLVGRLLADQPGRWRVIRLPAVAETQSVRDRVSHAWHQPLGQPDPLGREEGAPLTPRRFSSAALAELKVDVGSRAWSAEYMGTPTASEGGMFKRAWFMRRWTEDTLPKLIEKVLVVDAAFKTGVTNDPSAIHCWGTDGIDYFVLAELRGRWEFPDLKRSILYMAERHHPSAVLIEDTAAGQSAIQELRRETGLPIVAHKVTAPKEARASAQTPLCEAGKVVLPESAPWVGEWIDEHAAFPTGRHDDRVDNTSAALARLSRHALSAYQRMLDRPTTFATTLGQGKSPKMNADERLALLLGKRP